MQTKFTISDLERMTAEGKIKGFTVLNKGLDTDSLPRLKKQKKAGRAKYSNEKVEWDGQVFDSKREYKRYRELLMLAKAFKIAQLKRQVPYELNAGGTHSLKYIADFVYTDTETGREIVEDSKGFETREFKKKARLMKKVHGIEVKLT